MFYNFTISTTIDDIHRLFSFHDMNICDYIGVRFHLLGRVNK